MGGKLTYGKLRAAYGEVGTQPNPYLTVFSFLSGGTFQDGWGGTLTASQNGFGGLFSDTTRATQLKPERTRELELGTDLGLFNDAADFGFTFYNAKTQDVILNTPLPPSGGNTLQARNSAEFRNRGIEMTLNYRPLRRPEMQWNVGLNYAKNKSEVLSLIGTHHIFVDATASAESSGVWSKAGRR